MNRIMLAVTIVLMQGCSNESRPPVSEVDRYKLIQLGTMRRDQMIFDSATGRVWRVVCAETVTKGADCNKLVWQEETKI